LGWFSVHGQALATTFTLGVLLGIVRVGRGRAAGGLAPLGWAVLLIAAATSFGVGIGAAAAMPIVAWLLLPPGRQRRRIVTIVAGVAAAMPLLYIGLERLYVALYGGMPTSTYVGIGLPYLKLAIALLATGLLAIVAGPFVPLPEDPGIAGLAICAAY